MQPTFKPVLVLDTYVSLNFFGFVFNGYLSVFGLLVCSHAARALFLHAHILHHHQNLLLLRVAGACARILI